MMKSIIGPQLKVNIMIHIIFLIAYEIVVQIYVTIKNNRGGFFNEKGP